EEVAVVDAGDRVPQLRFTVGNRDHAQRLREVGVAGRANQQPVGLGLRVIAAALLAGAGPEPGLPTAAEAQRSGGFSVCTPGGAREGKRHQRASRSARFTVDVRVAEIAARAALLQPEVALAGGAAGVNEPAPVDIVDVP